MRSALRALTVRGRAFLASGLTSIFCGLVLIERDLTRMGLLVAALPLVSAMYVAGRSHHLRLHRSVTRSVYMLAAALLAYPPMRPAPAACPLCAVAP